MRHGCKPIGGSNPPLSATYLFQAVSLRPYTRCFRCAFSRGQLDAVPSEPTRYRLTCWDKCCVLGGHMARAVKKPTALTVSCAKEPGKYGDGDGLYLVVDPGGSRRWLMIFRQHNRQREMGLGSAAVVKLADASRLRDDARKLIAEGRDPIAKRKKPDSTTAKAVPFGGYELCSNPRSCIISCPEMRASIIYPFQQPITKLQS